MKDFSRKILMFIGPFLGYIIMRFLWYTSKKNFHMEGEFSQEQHIYVCWHGELFMSPQVYRYLHKTQKAAAMISHHYDGGLIAKVYSFLKIDAIRGSGRKGAKEVFLKAFRELKKGTELLLTPDGPRGPRHHMYDGAVGLAVRGEKPICVISFTCNRYWQLKSWDKFVIPKPFSHLDFYVQTLSLEGMDIEEAKVHLHQQMMKHTIP